MGAHGTVEGAAAAGHEGWRPAAGSPGASDVVADRIRRIRLTLFALAETADGAERVVLADELGRATASLEETVARWVEPVVAASIPGDVRRRIHQERHELRRRAGAVRRRARRLGPRVAADDGLQQLVDDLAGLAGRHLARLEDEVLGPWHALHVREPARRPAAGPAGGVATAEAGRG